MKQKFRKLISLTLASFLAVQTAMVGAMALPGQSLAADADIARLSYVGTPDWSVKTKAVSAEFVLQAQDKDGLEAISATDENWVNVTSSSATGRLSATSDFTAASNSLDLNFSIGTSTVSFYYRDETPGSYPIAVVGTSGAPIEMAWAMPAIETMVVTNSPAEISGVSMTDALRPGENFNMDFLAEDIDGIKSVEVDFYAEGSVIPVLPAPIQKNAYDNLVSVSYSIKNYPVPSGWEGLFGAKVTVVDIFDSRFESQLIPFRIDKTVPKTTLVLNPATPDGANGWYKSAFSVNFSVSDISEAETYYRWGSKDGEYSKFAGELRAPEGTNKLFYYSVDKLGHKEAIQESPEAYKVDTAVSRASILVPDFVNTRRINFSYDLSDALSGVEEGFIGFEVQREDLIVATGTVSPFVFEVDTDGVYSLALTVADKAGNVLTTKKDVVVDTVAPARVYNVSHKENEGSVVISWDKVEEGSLVKVYRDGLFVAALAGETTSFEDKNLEGGKSYGYRLVVVDEAGNESSVYEIMATTKSPAVVDQAPVKVATAAPVAPEKREVKGSDDVKEIAGNKDEAPKPTESADGAAMGWVWFIFAAIVAAYLSSAERRSKIYGKALSLASLSKKTEAKGIGNRQVAAKKKNKKKKK